MSLSHALITAGWFPDSRPGARSLRQAKAQGIQADAASFEPPINNSQDSDVMTRTSDSLLNLPPWLRRRLPVERFAGLRRQLREPLGWLFRNNLPKLAMIYGTDKWGAHRYAAHYATHFRHLRKANFTLLEIGIGGYSDSLAGGNSLRMWRRYFPNAQIVGLDYFDKSPQAEKRIRVYRGDQSDEELLSRIVAEVGRPDIVVDDGSHVNEHVIKTFEVLFPLLADDGLYAVEDTQTAYWPSHGGSSDDLQNAPTSMRLLKGLADGLNYEEFIRPGYTPSYFDQHVTSVHFYHNLVVIQKGRNDEGSNYLLRNREPSKH